MHLMTTDMCFGFAKYYFNSLTLFLSRCGYFVCFYVDSKGSVIADLELTFNTTVYENDVDGLLKEATKDKSLGGIPVNQVVVGETISEFLLFTSLFMVVV